MRNFQIKEMKKLKMNTETISDNLKQWKTFKKTFQFQFNSQIQR